MTRELKTLRANDHEFAYLEDGEGPLIVLVHGFPDDAHTWDELRVTLANEGYRAVSPFLRGYAPSGTKGPYDADTLGQDVAGWIDALGGGPAIVIGHDFGASASYAAAGLFPEKLRLLITVAIPHPASIKPSLSLLWSIRHFVTLRFPGAAKRIRKGNLALIDELWRRWSPTWKNIPPEETESVKRTLAQDGSLEAAIAYYAQGFALPQSHRKKITVPTASFAGVDDMLKPSDFERARSRFVDHYEVIECAGGHFMHREHPEEFTTKLLEVLKRLAPAN